MCILYNILQYKTNKNAVPRKFVLMMAKKQKKLLYMDKKIEQQIQGLVKQLKASGKRNKNDPVLKKVCDIA